MHTTSSTQTTPTQNAANSQCPAALLDILLACGANPHDWLDLMGMVGMPAVQTLQIARR